MTTIVGRFSDATQAQLALRQLEESGFTPRDVSLMQADTGTSNLVSVRAGEDTLGRARTILEDLGATAIDEEPSSSRTEEPANYGSEGGSSQWGVTLLTAEGPRDPKSVRNASKRRRA